MSVWSRVFIDLSRSENLDLWRCIWGLCHWLIGVLDFFNLYFRNISWCYHPNITKYSSSFIPSLYICILKAHQPFSFGCFQILSSWFKIFRIIRLLDEIRWVMGTHSSRFMLMWENLYSCPIMNEIFWMGILTIKISNTFSVQEFIFIISYSNSDTKHSYCVS